MGREDIRQYLEPIIEAEVNWRKKEALAKVM
jgi:hypothetical protein